MNLDQAFQTFIAECGELLQDMEDKLIGLVSSDDQVESINSIFRAAHTIKGSAGLFGLDDIVAFAHVVESVLDEVRAGKLQFSEDLVNLILRCKDHIGKMVESIADNQVWLSDADRELGIVLVTQLEHYLSIESVSSSSFVLPIDSDEVPLVVLEPSEQFSNENWHISVYFGRDVLRNGMDPLSFLRYLNTLGAIEHIETHTELIPQAGEMDPESCYLGFDINFSSEASKETIESAFEFVRDDCQLHIVPPFAKASAFIELIELMPGDDIRLGEILIQCGTITPRELENVLKQQREARGETKLLGEIVVEACLATPEVVTAAINKQASAKKAKEKQSQTIRVDADKLDYLINLIGELVIAGAGLESDAQQSSSRRMLESAQTLTRLIEDVRESALNLRMVQIGETFNRFQRVVRDVSQELGKAIDLQINGAETELDKTVVEKISDPLMHLVRNSIDHGIESPELRAERGKSPMGIVQLNAYHESGSIVIEVSDDGGGLNRQRILQKAIDKGLVPAGADLSDSEVYQLIFEAGFSTADSVSNISGRGVGMDVVRRNIEALRGSIEIDSRYGFGTTMRIRLPLTLAIIDGFMMRVGQSYFVVPLDIVEECLELELTHSGVEAQHYLNLRGEVLPYVRLAEYFQTMSAEHKRENIIVVKYGTQKAGLVVDELMGEFQTVIKPLGFLFEKVPGISGSTILGSGEVALILDAPALINLAVQKDNKTGIHSFTN